MNWNFVTNFVLFINQNIFIGLSQM